MEVFILEFRKAKMSDVEAIYDLINGYAAQGFMLPRSRSTLYESIREFTVIVSGGEIVGTGALHVIWDDLAEIRALALRPEYIRQGLGRRLVQRLLEEARELEIKRIFALTCQPEFFERCGFHLIQKEDMPQKVWKECINCPKFPHCDEVAVLYELV